MAKKDADIRLGRVELQIMTVVWERGTATVHDVKEALGRGRKPAYTTIMTMMKNLEAKGYLTHDVQERTYVYRAVISREAVRRGLLGDLLERVFEGSPTLLMSSLVEEKELSEPQLREIRKLIDRRRRKP